MPLKPVSHLTPTACHQGSVLVVPQKKRCEVPKNQKSRDITPKGKMCKANQPKNSSIQLEGHVMCMSSFVVRFVNASQCILMISECRKLTRKIEVDTFTKNELFRR